MQSEATINELNVANQSMSAELIELHARLSTLTEQPAAAQAENERLRDPSVNPNLIPIATFRDRFTPDQLVAIFGSTDPATKLLVIKLLTTTVVDIKSETVINGVAYLVRKNQIPAEQTACILEPMALAKGLTA